MAPGRRRWRRDGGSKESAMSRPDLSIACWFRWSGALTEVYSPRLDA